MASRHRAHDDADDSQMPSTGTPSPTQATSIAFIVHSADTLTNNLPPNVDNKPLARQKRRRTSPEDQAILEAEYLKNSKPDKAARMAIVKRVALGEKEVQIWFQNRRQASRRRSKPLELHEIMQYSRMRATHVGSPQAGFYGSEDASAIDATPTRPANLDDHDRAMTSTPDGDVLTSRTLPPLTASASRATNQTPLSASQEHATPSSYLADRRNDTARAVQQSQDDSPSILTSSQDIPAPRPLRDSLRRTSSSVRLSMSFDGQAKIITKDDSSPSPPRRQSSSYPLFRPATKEGTADPAADAENEDPEKPATSTLARKPSGRSRDSRSWEYWADKDARSTLTSKADQENSGSAAEAIGLLRSATRNPLAPLGNKRSSLFGEPDSAKRRRTPLLQRSQSLHNAQSPRLTGKKMKKVHSMLIPSDSDKENWSPERDTITPGKTLLAARVSSPPPESRRGKSNSVSEEEELDCVQGLLSLSQGAWK